MNSKLALGTVQFGLPYGVANTHGQVPLNEAQAIIDLAKSQGIKTLDTAIAYGESEKVLGSMGLAGFEIITKLPSAPEKSKDIVGWVDQQLEASLTRLNINQLDGLLLHRSEQLKTSAGDALYTALQNKKKEGLIKRIGISVYSPEELNSLISNYHFDLVQAPFNIIDNRLEKSGLIKKLAIENTQLHVRSVFMQGLLLMPNSTRPKKFNRWAALWSLWDEWLNDIGLTPLEACLRYALSVSQIEKVVVGVDSAAHLSEIFNASIGECPQPPKELFSSDLNLLNPSLWSQL